MSHRGKAPLSYRNPADTRRLYCACQIKFMSVDGQCAIVGNGNLDSQSFWHSQEANILIDNPQIVADWMDQLRTNQSTHKYGRVDTDGIWRDPTTGEELEKPKNISCFSAMRAVI